MQERRRAERFHANLNVRWESLKSQGRGSVCDLSSSGGFVLTGGDVGPGELVRVDLILTNDVCVHWGYVVYQIREMGFAVRFVFGSEAENQSLNSLIDSLKQS